MPKPCSGELRERINGSWETITFVAALRHKKIMAPLVVKGAMNGEMFLAYGSRRQSSSRRVDALDRADALEWERAGSEAQA
jgi:hypothetical protein